MYFNNFPNIQYPLSSDQIQQAKDLLVRLGISETSKRQTETLADYIIEEGQTPERIALEVYGSVDYNWVIMLMNDLLDPQYDFPMRSRTLDDYIAKKYPNDTFFLKSFNLLI